MPSPMIYQDLTTAALLGHAAQYHSETEIVSVSTGGEKERSSWGVYSCKMLQVVSRSAAGVGAGVAGAAARRPLRYPGMEQSPPP
ncbi:aMP-binding enzyme [Klebsiella variicola CAG:634]|nr:aMP-binding enzyme [Klebsiella variicola CAG:634]